MKHGRLSRLSFVFVCTLAMAGCGRQSELVQNQSGLLESALVNQLGSSNPVAQKTFQNELQQVMGEINGAVAKAVLPGFNPKSLATITATAPLCAPSFNFVLVGVGITFTPGAGCVLSGTINVTLFPTAVNVNLTAVGLTFIDKIALQGSVALGGNTAMTLTFLNGHIDINQIAGITLGSIVLNGVVALNASPAVKFTSRINAFASSNDMGVALLSTIDTSVGVANIQGCLLSGADPQNPQAGSTSPCFGI